MEIETINIIVSTNASNEKEFSLTKNVIYHPSITDTSKYSEYPFFTKYVDYNKIFQYINILSYKDLVDTFFIRSSFEKIMKLGYKPNLVNDENMNIYANANVNIMLSLLFPTTYPIKNNYENTFNTLIQSGNYNSTNLQLNMKNIFSFFNPNQYSYIKVSGNTYSIVKCVWLNDFFNHPVYFKLMGEYDKLLLWKVSENKKLNVEIKKKVKAFIQHLKKKDIQNKLLLVNEDFIKQSYAKYEMTTQVNRFKEAINKIVEIMKQYKSAKKKGIQQTEEEVFSKLQESLTIMVDNYDTLFKVIKGTSRDYTNYNIENGSLKTQVELIINLDKDIKMYNILVNSHITKQRYHPINFVYSHERVKEYAEKKYQKITNFKKLLESYNEPIRQSTNYDLQSEINNFQKGYENVLQDIMNPTNLMVDKTGVDSNDIIDINSIVKYLNVGVCISNPSEPNENKPVNEIYIKLFVVKGVLDDENKNVVNCMYKGDYLGDELYRLLNNDKSNLLLNVSNFQFDVDSKEVKAKIEESKKVNETTKDAAKKNKSESAATTRAPVQGGSRRRRKGKRVRKTRKLFFI
jgi:hypothetical protein